MYRIDPVPIPCRRRTFSVCYDAAEARAVATPTMARSSSDTELGRIDREKSFETAEAYRRTTGLLAQVVGALAAVNKAPLEDDDTTLGVGTMYGGYHGFSDSQILASEWSFPATNEMPRPRGRAASDFNLSPKTRLRRTTVAGQNEWTWSGDNDQIQEAINIRTRQIDRHRENLYRNSFGLPILDNVTQEEEQDDTAARRTSRIKKFSIPDGFRKLFPFKKRTSQTEFANAEDVEKAPNHRKFSVVSVPETMHYQNPALDYYSTVTANASPGYFSNGQSHLQPSQGNLNQRLSNGHLAESNSLSNTSYQRNVPMGAARKRRDSIFAQNPALANRRGSLYPPAAINQRRGSLFTTERRGSTASAMGVPTRRGSLFPVSAIDHRRPSILSATSQENQEVLENTTLADLIRALEAMHTQAVLDEAAESANVANKKKNRKSSSNNFEPNPLLSLFGNNDEALKAAAANRLYARRSTIVGTLPQTNQSSVNSNNASNLVNRRRLSTMHIQEPPPSYSKEATNNEQQQPQTAAQTKFKRRFSVRPTALQIPPGKAPPPGVNISTLTETGSAINSPTVKSTLAPLASPSQTVLQRRLSLRPSPLAISDGSSPTSPTSINPTSSSSSSTTRLLSPTARPSTTSTHSPLSRIVQISQAQRKSSMPEGFNARKGDQ